MKKLALFVILTTNFLSHAHGKDLSLDETLQAALETSPVLKTQNQNVLNARELLSQARGLVFPTLSLEANRFWRDQLGPFDPRRQQTSVALTVNQQLFNGAREYFAVEAVKEQFLIEEKNFQVSSRDIFRQIIQSFYEIIILEEDEINLNEQVSILNNRLKELSAQEKIGRARKSEILLARTQIMNTQINIQTTQRFLESEWLNLSRISGVDKANLLIPLDDKYKLKNLDWYLEKIPQMPDVVAAKKRIELAHKQVNVEKLDHFPKVAFRGNYYLEREGFINDLGWDFSLSLSLPIFEGGVTQSQVRQAVIAKNTASIGEFDLINNLKTEITNLHQGIEQDLNRLNFLRETLKLSNENYLFQKRENNLGLVTNLDVLQALNTYIETKRTETRLKLEIKRNLSILRLITGEGV